MWFRILVTFYGRNKSHISVKTKPKSKDSRVLFKQYDHDSHETGVNLDCKPTGMVKALNCLNYIYKLLCENFLY